MDVNHWGVQSFKLTAARLFELGYFLREGYWWRADDVHLFESPAHFDLPVGRRRRDGSETRSMFDPHDLTVVQIAPAIGPPTVAELDWHVLAPFRVTDPNGAVTEVRYDPLGVVVAASRYGQVACRPWGHASLSVHAPRTPSSLADVFASPEHFLQDASEFVFYDIDAWLREQSPVAVARLARESLLHDGFGSVPSGEGAGARGLGFEAMKWGIQVGEARSMAEWVHGRLSAVVGSAGVTSRRAAPSILPWTP